VNDDGCCIVARIMHGGMIHKQGLFTAVSNALCLVTLSSSECWCLVFVTV